MRQIWQLCIGHRMLNLPTAAPGPAGSLAKRAAGAADPTRHAEIGRQDRGSRGAGPAARRRGQGAPPSRPPASGRCPAPQQSHNRMSRRTSLAPRALAFAAGHHCRWRDRLRAVAAQIGQCVAPPARRTRPVASLWLVFACGRVRPACGGTVGSAGGHDRRCSASRSFRAEARRSDDLPGRAVRCQGERRGARRPACADLEHTVAGGGAGRLRGGRAQSLGYLQGLLGYWADGFEAGARRNGG